jgi:hypothetical protein
VDVQISNLGRAGCDQLQTGSKRPFTKGALITRRSPQIPRH